MYTRLQVHWFLVVAKSFLGVPYRWGGDDPTGFDCSGLVVEAARAVGLLNDSEDFTADGLYRRWVDSPVSAPFRGCLAFRLSGEGRAEHVAVCLNRHLWIEAAGGGRDIVNSEQAWKSNAWVKIRPIRRTAAIVFCDPFRRNCAEDS